MAVAVDVSRPRKVSYFNYGPSRRGRRYVRASTLCSVDATFRIVSDTGDHTLPTMNMPLGSSTRDYEYPLADLAPGLTAWCDHPESLDRLLRYPEVRAACATLANDGQFRHIELWQGRLSAVYEEPGTCGEARATAILDRLVVIAEVGEQVWARVERNWALERFWNGGGRVAVIAGVVVLLLFLATVFL